jgi:hypothetical protein
MNLKPWREIAVPHSDVLKGTFPAGRVRRRLLARARWHRHSRIPEPGAVLPAHLHHRGHAPAAGLGGQAPDREGRRSGHPAADRIRRRQDAHDAGRLPPGQVEKPLPVNCQGMPAILDTAGITELPRARIAVLDGIKSSPNQPVRRDGQVDPHAVG